MSITTAAFPSAHLSQRGQRAPEQPISKLMALALANPSAISLAAGFVDNHTLPVDEVSLASQKLFADRGHATAALQYGTTIGQAGLRLRIAQRYFQDDPGRAADSMILTAGSNQFLQLASDCLLDPGDIVLCAAPTYFVYLYVLKDLDARAVGVEIDDQGMIPAELDATLERLAAAGELHRVRALYLVPYFDNPAATNMSTERRLQIIEVVNRWRDRAALMMLVDNAYRDLRYEGEDVASMLDLGADPQTTVETGTFSKNLSPGIRVGWGVPPEPLHTAMERRKSLTDFGSPHFCQAIVAEVLASGQFDEHLGLLRATYAKKRDAMLAACQRYLSHLPGVHFQSPQGGLYVWLTLPDEVNAGPSGPLWQAAIEAGVLYVPGEFFYPNEGYPVRRNCLRLSFGVQSEERITEGIKVLADTLATSN